MNNENEIERIAKFIGKAIVDSITKTTVLDTVTVAKYLLAQGIGDKKQAVEEFTEKLKENNHVKLDGNSFVLIRFTDLDNLIAKLYGDK